MSATFTALDFDAELWVRTILTPALPGVRVGTETPSNLETVAPLIAFHTLGGQTGVNTQDVSVSVQAFDVTYTGAQTLARNAGKALYAARSSLPVAGATLTYVSGTVPAWVPYDNPNVRRVVATYRLLLKTV